MKELKVTLVTKNQYKIESTRLALAPFGIKLELESFDVPEIQADTSEEIAMFSAQWAANKCGKPVIKADSGMFIEALNGLPGIYTSQFQKRLGPEKVLSLLENENNRKAKIVYALAYCEPNSEPKVFTSGCEGTISKEVLGDEGMLIDYIFIPNGSNYTMGQLRDIDLQKRTEAWGDAEVQFAKWFVKYCEE
jgi:XTP/dITP diphosphohydrolase